MLGAIYFPVANAICFVRYVRCAHVNAKSHNLTKRAARKKAFSKGEKGDRSGFPERAKLFWGFAPAVDEDALILMNI